MIRKYIQNIISESIENIRAKEIEQLKNMLQTSYYKIQTRQNIDVNKAKFEYASNILTSKHNINIDDVLEPTKRKLENERIRKEYEERQREEQKKKEAEKRSERWSQNEPNKPRTDMEVAMNTIHMRQQGYRWDDVYQRWIKDDY